ncbi:MAG: PorT family protein [Chitinophagaceae bacterium]|nr:PorT family protein [Chitinophagaceae bacterium]
MKKILTLTVTLIIIALAVKAQSPRFGFNSGIALANMSYKDEDGKEKSDSRIGLNAGIMVDIPIGHNLSIQPGINFIQKGAKEKETEGTYSMEASTRINYLEVPVNFVYKAPVKKGHLFIGAGPSAGYALKGNVKTKFSDGQTTETEENKIYIGNKDDDDLKPFELSMNVLGGYEFNSGFQIAVNYNRSLNNLLTGDTGSSSLRNSYFGIKIGYLLRKRN